MITVDDVINKVLGYNSKANTEVIRKAFEYSSKAHEGQIRKSGHPFVLHPLEVAMTLAEMKLDVESVVAAILHDTIEDTASTKEEIQKLFGTDIAELVDGVTKLSKLPVNTREERQAESLRKMVLAMSKDIRVILIKLADRLNNIKTLQFMSEERQMSIAQETLDIYAPLANRLGIQWMKIQLEDLSFRFMHPDIYKQLEKKISRLKKNRENYIARVEKTLEEHFEGDIPHYLIQGRMKHTYGIYQKMERQDITFEQVFDLMAFRIITKNVEECYEALGQLHSIWKPVPGRFKDYIAMPKDNNYQSLHTTVICLDGERVEFQIRTEQMHQIAEQGIAAHWKYKDDGQLDMKSEATFQWLRQLVSWQKELKDSFEFMDTVKIDLFPHEIYVFTPKGDVRALPYGSTPIDFAYSIHSDVGTHCAGARINGKLVPLNHKLESGDEVEIITNNKSHPTKDWLNAVASSRAKARIRQFLKEVQRDKSIELGREIFEGECVKHKLDSNKFIKEDIFKDYLKEKELSDIESFYSAIAYGKISMTSFLKYIQPSEDGKEFDVDEGIIRKIFNKVSKRTKDWVQVSGIDDVLVTFARCCSPIQGDTIVGFVTRGRGVTIHRVECPKVPSIDPQRRVDVNWNMKVALFNTAKLRIVTENRTGMLAKIALKVSEKKINISKAIVRTTRDEKAIVYLDIGIGHVQELHALMKSVSKLDGVIAVQREIT